MKLTLTQFKDELNYLDSDIKKATSDMNYLDCHYGETFYGLSSNDLYEYIKRQNQKRLELLKNVKPIKEDIIL